MRAVVESRRRDASKEKNFEPDSAFRKGKSSKEKQSKDKVIKENCEGQGSTKRKKPLHKPKDRGEIKKPNVRRNALKRSYTTKSFTV